MCSRTCIAIIFPNGCNCFVSTENGARQYCKIAARDWVVLFIYGKAIKAYCAIHLIYRILYNSIRVHAWLVNLWSSLACNDYVTTLCEIKQVVRESNGLNSPIKICLHAAICRADFEK